MSHRYLYPRFRFNTNERKSTIPIHSFLHNRVGEESVYFSSISRGPKIQRPETWCNSNQTLVEVPPGDEQCWRVANQLKTTTPESHISKVWRVQNEELWTYITLQKHRLAINGIRANESAVWHGATNLDPSVDTTVS